MEIFLEARQENENYAWQECTENEIDCDVIVGRARAVIGGELILIHKHTLIEHVELRITREYQAIAVGRRIDI